MSLDITVRLTGDETSTEMNALAALINVLAGRTLGNVVSVPAALQDEARAIVGNVPTISTSASSTAAPLGSTVAIPDADDDDPAAIAGAPDRDSAGVPWDERIHASSRATNADKTWRRRKNTPDATYDAVMVELRGVAPNAPAASAATGPDSSIAAGVSSDGPNAGPNTLPDDTPPPPTSITPVATASAAVAATTAAEDVPPPPSGGPDLSNFPKFVAAINAKDVPAEKKVYGALNELCATFGVAAFKDMKDKPGDWAMFYDMVGE